MMGLEQEPSSRGKAIDRMPTMILSVLVLLAGVGVMVGVGLATDRGTIAVARESRDLLEQHAAELAAIRQATERLDGRLESCASSKNYLDKVLARWSGFRVMDTHIHLTDWSVIDYTYPKTSVNYRNWTTEAYLLDSAYAVFPMPDEPSGDSCFFMMGLVGVTHDQQLLQTTWSQSIADGITEGPRMCGIVTTLDYEKDLKGDIDAFKTFLDDVEAGAPLNVGFRCSFTTLEEEANLPAFQEIARRGKTFDVFTGTLSNGVWTTSLDKLKSTKWLATRVPSLKLVVDHMGLPGVPGAEAPDFDKWASGMEPLVAHPNVYIKVSGGAQGMEAMRPFFSFCVEKFGYDRLLWSSNWYNIKVQEGFYGYNSWAASVAQYLIDLRATDDDVKKLLWDTAAAVYQVSGAAGQVSHIA